jgi:hypothetical protein
MGFTEPDSAPTAPAQMPQAATPGPAAVPYDGPGMALAPDMRAPMPGVPSGMAAAAGVLDGVTGANHVTESPLAAPDVTPYYAGAPQAIYVGGDDNPGGRDDVAGSVAGAVANAEARYGEHQADTYAQGSTIGDVMTFPPSPLDPGAGPGLTLPTGHYYDPDRDY